MRCQALRPVIPAIASAVKRNRDHGDLHGNKMPVNLTCYTSAASAASCNLVVAGQGLFAMRFILQWLTSEGQGRSVIPVAFWYFSIGGGSVLLLYAIWRQDPVIICGQGLGLFIYLRNLYFIYRTRNGEEAG